MNFVQINIQSMYAKREFLENYLAQTSVDVVLLGETWERENKTFNVRGYRLFSKPRSDGYGGVGILLKHTINIDTVSLPTFEFIEAIAVKTRNLDRNILIMSIYVAPAVNAVERLSTVRDFQKLFEWIERQNDLIIGGDMNAHSRVWGCSGSCVRGKQLENLIVNSNIVLLNDGRPTRVAKVNGTASAIDITLVSIGLAAEITWGVLDENLGSDHFLIEMKIGRNISSINRKNIFNEKRWVEDDIK